MSEEAGKVRGKFAGTIDDGKNVSRKDQGSLPSGEVLVVGVQLRMHVVSCTPMNSSSDDTL